MYLSKILYDKASRVNYSHFDLADNHRKLAPFKQHYDKTDLQAIYYIAHVCNIYNQQEYTTQNCICMTIHHATHHIDIICVVYVYMYR